jgi:23S rRNA (cytidine1920-2'-O)/16S rRNA (cytidine1409-2'-O)-methyltransferase
MTSMTRLRLDQALVQRGLVESRERGQALIRAGLVAVSGAIADHPDQLVDGEAAIEVKGRAPFVSRGGEKLDAALRDFHVDVRGRVCLDVGASTGGFTDVLLQRGANAVVAVDVGYGQLAWSLRQDPRVHTLERVNIRELAAIPLPATLATIDVSFISLRQVLPAVKRLLRSPGDVIALVKPQFEVGRGRVGKGGVVRDPALHDEVLRSLRGATAGIGYRWLAQTASPISGAKGNREFFVHLRPV